MATIIPLCELHWHVSFRHHDMEPGSYTYHVTTASSESEAIQDIRDGFTHPIYDVSAHPMGAGIGERITVWDLETTDTFGGEANYCWVNRSLVCTPDLHEHPKLAIRRVRAAAGLTGVRTRFEDAGHYLRWDQRNACVVTFASPREN